MTPPAWDRPRVAVVTGAGSGIGRAVALRLAEEGARVALLDLDGEAAERVAAEIASTGATAVALTVDVTDRAAVDAAVAGVCDRLGPPTILVTSAGLDGFHPFLDITEQQWDRILGVNLTGTFQCCQAVAPHMVEDGWGRIVTISSSSAQTGNPLMTHYSAAKAGVVGFTKALALELGPRGITVNTVPPGFVDTPMLRKTESRGFLGDGIDHHQATTPVRRVGRPEDIAAACAYLVRDEAGYITGQIIGVNGGRTT
ncbi:SDR family NAD(P)-dependent oxidoreductase [Yinghuangia sp. YIM S10712]|uniref:SDR family NAD(P)-dependent oxidoreductase n=1 Tax=Yinghuangia sp. YIM S10712 TaxID=3436930 RepID=UPI003F5395F4